MKNIAKLASLTLIAAALAALPVLSQAQNTTTTPPATDSGTNAPAAPKKKAGALPFHGKIATIDASAGKFTVGKLELNITSKTKITSTNGVPATLADFKVGAMISGAYKKTADGTLNVTTMHLGGGRKKTPAPAAQ